MDGRHEQGLVAWANTFSSSFPEGAAPAASLADFTTGDALIPITRTILGDDHDDDSGGAATASGWAGVFSYLHSADLIDEDVQVPTEEASKRDMAVTCLEALLHHTCQDSCAGRATFIRQIMSLDTDVQSVLRHVVAGEEPSDVDGDASSSEAGSPSRDDRDGGASSFAGSPPLSTAAHRSPASGSRRRRTSITTSGSSYDSSHSDEEDDLGLKSWYSPHPTKSARRKSKVPTGGGTGERAARVGPRPPRNGRTLDMEEAEEALVGATAASAAPFPPPAPPASCAAGWTATAVEVRGKQPLLMPIFRCRFGRSQHVCVCMLCCFIPCSLQYGRPVLHLSVCLDATPGVTQEVFSCVRKSGVLPHSREQLWRSFAINERGSDRSICLSVSQQQSIGDFKLPSVTHGDGCNSCKAVVTHRRAANATQ